MQLWFSIGNHSKGNTSFWIASLILKEEKVEKKILLSIAPQGKKKEVTVGQGLKSFSIDLKVVSKFFGQND